MSQEQAIGGLLVSLHELTYSPLEEMTRNAKGTFVGALLAASVFVGCHGNVQLTAPAVDAPESGRWRAY